MTGLLETHRAHVDDTLESYARDPACYVLDPHVRVVRYRDGKEVVLGADTQVSKKGPPPVLASENFCGEHGNRPSLALFWQPRNSGMRRVMGRDMTFGSPLTPDL